MSGTHQLMAQSCPSWAVVGNATTSGSSVTLTTAAAGQSGAAWNTTPVDLTQAFTLSFNAYFGAASGGADGIAFVLQNDLRGLSAISGNGQPCGFCLGYGGINPITPSVAFPINTYQTNGVMSAWQNGVTTQTCAFLGAPGNSCPYTFTSQIANNATHAVTIQWDPATTTLTWIVVDSGGTPQTMTYTRDLVNDVFFGQTTVYYGFTGATGGAFNLQYVTAATCNTPTPTPACASPVTFGKRPWGGIPVRIGRPFRTVRFTPWARRPLSLQWTSTWWPRLR